MQYVNKYNLPQYLVDWLTRDDYDHNSDPLTLSATTLMKPVRAYWLTRRHGDNLTVDVSELIASRLGNAIHDSIEQVETPNVSKEQRLSRKLEMGGISYTISGKYDIMVYDESTKKWTIRDIKTTSVWAWIYGGKDEDYRKQLSIYRWLAVATGVELEPVACIDFIFTDWQSQKAKTEDNYPQQRIKAGYKIELLSLEETERYIRERLENFFTFKELPDTQLPLCTKEELWATEDTFAVMKAGAQRATKVCETREEAEIYIRDKQIKTAFVEFRQGKAKRCKYCSAAPFCDQFKRLTEQRLVEYF